MSWWPIPFALLAASLLPIQAALNNAMNRALHRPPLVVIISVSCSLLFMVGVLLLQGRVALPSGERVAAVPWWAWPAGVCGAVFLLSQPIVLPRVGAAVYIGLTVTAQVVMALALDHFGALGVPQHAASPLRLLGAALMVGGVALIASF